VTSRTHLIIDIVVAVAILAVAALAGPPSMPRSPDARPPGVGAR
jgi:hypothetical protein